MPHPQRLRHVLVSDQLLVTPEEAAKLLRVGRTTVFALMKAGELHPVHIGRSCRLSRAELERYVGRLEGHPAPRRRSRRRLRTDPNQRELLQDENSDTPRSRRLWISPDHPAQPEPTLNENDHSANRGQP